MGRHILRCHVVCESWVDDVTPLRMRSALQMRDLFAAKRQGVAYWVSGQKAA